MYSGKYISSLLYLQKMVSDISGSLCLIYCSGLNLVHVLADIIDGEFQTYTAARHKWLSKCQKLSYCLFVKSQLGN